MKKLYFSLVAILMASTSVFADPVDLQKAKTIAQRFMKDGQAPQLVQTPTLRVTNSNAPLYIFNRGENQGFVIISGDNCMPEILGYTESGDFIPDEMPPALLDWLDGYKEMITAAQAANAPARIQTRAVSLKQDVDPLVQTHWHQSSPYNDLCPFITNTTNRALTGCVATAAAQAIYYWHKETPTRTGYDTPTYGYGAAPVTESTPEGTPLQWELMQLSYGSNTPDDMKNAVAVLNVVVGTSTYLTYGSSTSGQISKLVDPLNRHFNLNSRCLYKSGYSQDSWENLIYNNLIQGMPIVYSGVHPTSGGHAVILDGYRSSDNLFHFNFGWGGQGDGWYTVNDTNGMNGFSGQQGMTFDIFPKTLKLEGKILSGEFYKRMDSPVTFELTNNGTTAYSGLYLFAETSSTTKPSDINDAAASNTTTKIASGTTGEVIITYKPTRTGTQYIYITDKNCRILDQRIVEVQNPNPDLTTNSFVLNNTLESTIETVNIDGTDTPITVYKIYNENMISATANLTNSPSASLVMPSVACQLMTYNSDKQSFINTKRISISDYYFNSGETKDIVYNFDELNTQDLYAIEISDTYQAGSVYDMKFGDTPTIYYFRLAGSDLTFTPGDEYTMKVTGHWNDNTFQTMAQDETIANYDLSEITGTVNTQPVAANPNALFYVSADTKLKGINIISDNKCENLSVQNGYNFKPSTDFTAVNAQAKIGNNGFMWTYVALPFDCDMPAGSMARKITKVSTASIMADSANTSIKKCTPYLIKTCQNNEICFTANNVTVSVNSQPDCNDENIKCTFIAKEKTGDERVLNLASPQKFTLTSLPVEPFSGYITASNDLSTSIFSYSSKDTETDKLGAGIQEAHLAAIKYESLVSEQNYKDFTDCLEKAENVFTQQPSKAEITAMTTDLLNAVNTLKTQEIFNGTPIDYTDMYLANPSFEESTRTPSDWDVESSTGQSKKILTISDIDDYVAHAQGENVFYSYSTTDKGSVTISQTINNLPVGTYRLTAMIGTEEGKDITLYANSYQTVMTGDDFGPRYLQEVTVDSIEVEDGTLTIGIKGNDSWYKADNFRLYYIDNVTTDISEVKADTGDDLKIWSDTGRLCIESTNASPVKVNIYTISGQLIKQLTVNGHENISLKSGIYLVNQHKIIIR